MEKIIAIVQARLTSSRLPGKVLLNLNDKPVISQVFKQLKYSKYLSDCVLATSNDSTDDPLEKWALDNNMNYFRGDLNNVLKRFYYAAVSFDASVIVRITADCPLIDPEVVDEVIKGFVSGGYDYFANVNPPSFPDGLDVEVFSLNTLKKAYLRAEKKSELEHVTLYIRNHPELFRIGNFVSETNYEKIRLTLDNIEDYNLISTIYNKLYLESSFIKWRDVISFLNANKNLYEINLHINRNEGLSKSILND